MSLPAPAKLCLSCGLLGLALTVSNQLTAGSLSPPLERAGVLASLLAVGLMLVAVLWTRAVPEAAARAPLTGREGLELAEGLSAAVAEELGWGSRMLLTATPAAVVLVQWKQNCLLRRGLLADTPFTPGAICRQAMARGRVISLVNLALYPGREEFAALLPELPAVVVQPLGEAGVLVVGGWAPRCFSRADLTWIEGWSQRLTERLAGVCAPPGVPPDPAPGTERGEPAAGS
ncbi:cofactor assembly of complex C subunit B [Cyanobium sp. LEGE 06113]|uniref:cofactor assembly of complex C subunit B n=1 Tax=Cyanobium sp. LEGE 06113 TaxID=1297573 RepID=UPI001D13F784|nr:cofactor assembly of complex C subunit B [Cyanobium sp. LEGE 06113]